MTSTSARKYTSARQGKTARSRWRLSRRSSMLQYCHSYSQAKITYFHFQKKKFIFDSDQKVFVRQKPSTKFPLSYFHRNLTSTEYKIYKYIDDNVLDFPMPQFTKIFNEQVMDPLNFFQLFSVALWFFDDNFFHPIMTIVMVMISIFSVAVDRMTTMMNLRSLILKPQYIK